MWTSPSPLTARPSTGDGTTLLPDLGGQGKDLADEAFERWFQAALSDPPKGVRRILRRRSKGQRPREMLRSALDSLLRCRDFPGPWRRDAFDRDSRIDALFEQLKELGDLAAGSSRNDDYLAHNLAEIADFVEDNTQLEAVRGRDYDGLEAKLRELMGAKSWKWKGLKSTSFGALSRDEALSRRDQAKADLDAFIAASDADLAPLLHEELQAAVSAYQDLKANAGQLDFLDLLKADMVRATSPSPSVVRGCRAVLVDGRAVLLRRVNDVA